jgi:hypothetical protein
MLPLRLISTSSVTQRLLLAVGEFPDMWSWVYDLLAFKSVVSGTVRPHLSETHLELRSTGSLYPAVS